MKALADQVNCTITMDIYTHIDMTTKLGITETLARFMEDEGQQKP